MHTRAMNPRLIAVTLLSTLAFTAMVLAHGGNPRRGCAHRWIGRDGAAVPPGADRDVRLVIGPPPVRIVKALAADELHDRPA